MSDDFIIIFGKKKSLPIELVCRKLQKEDPSPKHCCAGRWASRSTEPFYMMFFLADYYYVTMTISHIFIYVFLKNMSYVKYFSFTLFSSVKWWCITKQYILFHFNGEKH